MMPTKRRVLIFLVVLAVMMMGKYLWGQDNSQSVAWDPVSDGGGADALSYGQFAMIGSPILGLAIGLLKAMKREMAARGALFTSEMARLRL